MDTVKSHVRREAHNPEMYITNLYPCREQYVRISRTTLNQRISAGVYGSSCLYISKQDVEWIERTHLPEGILTGTQHLEDLELDSACPGSKSNSSLVPIQASPLSNAL